MYKCYIIILQIKKPFQDIARKGFVFLGIYREIYTYKVPTELEISTAATTSDICIDFFHFDISYSTKENDIFDISKLIIALLLK